MINKKKMTRMFLIGPIVGTMLGVGILIGCAGDIGLTEGRDPGGTRVSQEISERGGGESGGEHGSRAEVSEGGESGSEGPGGGGSEEGSGAMLAPDETFDTTRAGARLIMSYDAPSNAFVGTVENTTGNILDRVRIEVHLSNGTELGPTTPVDMAPGQVLAVNMSATPEQFTGWIPHAEVGGGEGSGEHGSGGESGGEHGGSGESSGEHGSGRERRDGG